MSTTYRTACDTCGFTGGPYTSQRMADYALSRHSCDRHQARAAHAQAAADKAAERERLIDRTPQPCHHKKANHQHGTYVTYTQDRCRCTPCTTAAGQYNARLRRRNAYGRSNLIDADPVRAHIRQLMAAGIGLKQVTKHTGINGGVLCKLMYGVPETGRVPSKRILKANAAKILALNPDDPTLLAGGVRVDSTGTRRRLQALVHQGWSVNQLAAHADTDRQRLDGALHGRDVTKTTADTVAALYDRLWDTEPPRATRGEKTAYARARNIAAAAGWVGPLAWDDESIDDPAATPDTGQVVRDLGSGTRKVHLEDVEFLMDQQTYTWDGLAARLRVRPNTIDVALRRAGRQDLIDRLVANTRGTAA